ncbi:M15 family metallopeptidase [Kordiimonas sp.]|uniref:M15 family metallopeptidase n=1 Tax=Kordiimonas sp. TaxID=1970157 RepID=UPI003A947BE7
MYDFDHRLVRADLKPIRKPHNKIPVDDKDPRYHEPLVNLRDYDVAFRSWHAIDDGTNPPYHKPIRGARQEGWLRRSIAEKLQRVNSLLAVYGAEVMILDAYRPIACQRGLWEFFYERGREENPDAGEDVLRAYALQYVRDPRVYDKENASTWPIHITGSSVDVILRDRKTMALLNMGSAFEEMNELAVADYFERELAAGRIADQDERLWNRRLLDWAMRSEGFLNDPIVYWHFDWGNQAWIKVKNALYGDAPAMAWYGHIDAPAWGVPDAALATAM